VKRLVVDAPLIASWFEPGGAGRGLRAEYEAGTLVVIGPTQLPRDVLGEIARRGDIDASRLSRIGAELGRLGFELHDPSLVHVADWISRGLAPERAGYAAVAAELGLPLATDDDALRRGAAELTRPPSDA
jgi:predicted nucleic acid-binding protein